MTYNKFQHGDPLFAATLLYRPKKAPKSSDEDSHHQEDPMYQELMIHTPTALHNYYSEFRLGQGDPLLKAVMKTWPCTSLSPQDDADPDYQLRNESCNTVLDPASGVSHWTLNDIVRFEKDSLMHDISGNSKEMNGRSLSK